MPAKVIIINRSPLERESISRVLNGSKALTVAAAFGCVRNALGEMGGTQPKIIVVDLHDTDGGQALELIRRVCPKAKIVVSGLRASGELLLQCANAGASGFILRRASAKEWEHQVRGALKGEIREPRVAGLILELLKSQLAGRPTPRNPDQDGAWAVSAHVEGSARRAGLTPRERQIVELIDRGMTNKEIARELNVELSTIKNHVHSVLAKYKVRRRAEAAARFRESLGEQTGRRAGHKN